MVRSSGLQSPTGVAPRSGELRAATRMNVAPSDYGFRHYYSSYLFTNSGARFNGPIWGKGMHRVRTSCLALVLFAAPLCLARDLAIIVEKSNATSSVTALELEKLFKAVVQKWPDGKKVRVFLADPGSTGNRTLLQRLYKLAPEEMKTFVDTHKADIQVVSSDEVVLTLVASNPGAIGIVDVYSINSQVKVVKVDEKLPLEQGYLLHGN